MSATSTSSVCSVPRTSIVPARLPSGRGEQRQHLDPTSPVTGGVPPNRCATESAAAGAPVSPPGPHPAPPRAPCPQSPPAAARPPPPRPARPAVTAHTQAHGPLLALARAPAPPQEAGEDRLAVLLLQRVWEGRRLTVHVCRHLSLLLYSLTSCSLIGSPRRSRHTGLPFLPPPFTQVHAAVQALHGPRLAANIRMFTAG